MAIEEFYLEKGFRLLSKSVVLTNGGTHSVWIPKAGHRVIVTSLQVTSLDVAGTVAFYFDNGNDKIAMYFLAASGSINPVISGWESTVSGGRIFANKVSNQTDGLQINLGGFEIPIAQV